jgi:GT2 family glycosyltransferase
VVSLIRADGTASRRARVYCLGVADRFAASVFYPQEPALAERIETIAIVRGRTELRIHHVSAPFGGTVRGGGFAIASPRPPEALASDGWSLVRGADGLTSVIAPLHGFGATAVQRNETTNPFGHYSATPYVAHHGELGPEAILASLIVLTRDDLEPDDLRHVVTHLEVAGRRVMVCLDEEWWYLQLVAPEHVDRTFRGRRMSGPVRAARVSHAERWIADQLAALAAQNYPGDWELIVADNMSTDNTRTIALSSRARFPRLTIIDASGLRRPSHARNQGALAASGDVLLFTDADDIVCPDWIARLSESVRDSPIATGPVEHFVDSGTPARHDAQRPRERPRAGPFDSLTGGNMGTTRELFLELGGFDETLAFGWSDFDFGARATLRGIPIVWVERAVVRRRRPSSVRAMWKKEFTYRRGWTTLERRYPQLSPRGWRTLLERAAWIGLRAPYVALPRSPSRMGHEGGSTRRTRCRAPTSLDLTALRKGRTRGDEKR